MDIKNIQDVDKLKAIAYDEMMRRDIATQNLQVLHARITQLENNSTENQGAQTADKPADDKPADSKSW